MKRDSAEIGHILEQRFAGNLLYMPIHRTAEDAAPRPLAMLFPDLPQQAADMAPRSLSRQNSGLHLQGLLHHTPAPHQPQRG